MRNVFIECRQRMHLQIKYQHDKNSKVKNAILCNFLFMNVVCLNQRNILYIPILSSNTFRHFESAKNTQISSCINNTLLIHSNHTLWIKLYNNINYKQYVHYKIISKFARCRLPTEMQINQQKRTKKYLVLFIVYCALYVLKKKE